MTRTCIKLGVAGALALSLAAPAFAEKADALLVNQYRDKIAAARALPPVARNGSAELDRATALLPALADNLDDNEPKEAEDIAATIDTLIETARTRARLAEAKTGLEQARASAGAATQTRLASAKAAAADAQAAAATAQANAEKAQADNEALRRSMAEYQLKQSQLGATLVLQDVVFQTGRAELKPGAAERLRPLATYLQGNPAVRVRIDGHTDAQGSESYNQQLSNDRAAAVRTALGGMGVDPARIEAIGHGESKPAADNATASGRQQNRRVEVTLVGQQASAIAALR